MRCNRQPNRQSRRYRRAFTAAVLAALAVAFGVAEARAPELPGSRAIEDLELSRELVVEIDGETDPGARVWHSRRELAWVVSAPGLPELLLVSPRGRSVQALDRDKLTTDAEIGASLSAAAVVKDLGVYEKRRGVIAFPLGEHEVRLVPRPPLLGRQDAATVENRHPGFGPKARTAARKAAAGASIPVPPGEVLVRVYFASWSPICERIVPKIMALEERLRGRVRFEYYGLPKPLTDDPIVREEGITGVPTVLVSVDGEEIGRLQGRALDRPGEALAGLFGAWR